MSPSLLMSDLLSHWQPQALAAAQLLGAFLGGYLLHRLLWRTIRRIGRETSMVFDDSLARHCQRPTVFFLPVVAVYLALPFVAEALEASGASILDRPEPSVALFVFRILTAAGCAATITDRLRPPSRAASFPCVPGTSAYRRRHR